ncbi:maturation of Asn-linked oligosaccharides protein [Orbilia ellipsospora]|uniref:alpha-1,2-Mannosidase n=1 Tax=Orbilia ellipsospora TaxID=2528407 RepID=A0AAV9XMW9_9PEZI
MFGMLRRTRVVLLVVFFIAGSTLYMLFDYPSEPSLHAFFPPSGIQLDAKELRYRTDAIKEAYMHSWNGYMKYAYPTDELMPMSQKGGNSMSGWGASIIDGLGTATLMELHSVVETQLKFIAKVDYTKNENVISLFETTIRYLGGMLSAFDLLSGPYAESFKARKGEQNYELVNELVNQSIKLADAMKFAFNSTTGIPAGYFRLTDTSINTNDVNIIAGIGTLVLEWTRLSDITGDPQYAQLAQRAQEYLLVVQNPEVGEPFPGLLGTHVRLNDGKFQDSFGGWGALSDSYYEYLIKMFVYDKRRFLRYKERWVQAAESTIKYLASSPASRTDLVYVAEYSNHNQISFKGSHLACFIGGNFLLGGQVLKNTKYNVFGLRLVDGCHNTYSSTPSGLGPENFAWDESLVPAGQKEFFTKNGFYYSGSIDYRLRPEVIESYYHAYMVTRDNKYREWAWDAFKAINSTCRTSSGFTTVSDVSQADGGKKADKQESFWFAEVLKYLFLIFNEEGVQGSERIGFVRGSKQKWVITTEAHPFRVQD